MRNALMAAAVASSLALAGCATQPLPDGSPGPLVDPVKVAQVQNTAKQICGFLPTATTVASIIATFTGGGAIVDTVGQAANGICAAITSKGARRGGVAKYRGVTIRGEYVGR